jgi:hypothetical protein
MGAEHPDTIDSLHAVAQALSDQGHTGEAETLFHQVSLGTTPQAPSIHPVVTIGRWSAGLGGQASRGSRAREFMVW